MAGTCCCVPGCSNRGNGHSWPKDKEMSKKWFIAVRRDDNFDPQNNASQNRKMPMVCKNHFKPEDYRKTSYHGNYVEWVDSHF